MIMDRLKDAWSKADKEGKSEAVVLASDLSVAIQRLEDIYSGVDLLHVKALVAEETRKLEMTKKQIESLAGIDKAELENQMSQMDRERHNLISENLALTRERNRLILNDNSFKEFLARYRAASEELVSLAKEIEDDEVNRQTSAWANDQEGVMDSEKLDQEMSKLYVMSDPCKELQDCRQELLRVQSKLIEFLLEARYQCHCSK